MGALWRKRTTAALTAKRDAVLLRWIAHSSIPQGKLTGLLVSRIAGGHIVESWTDKEGYAQHT